MNPATFQQAFLQRWTSMRRKLPIIIAAAFACYGLYYLDVVKRRFDEEKSTPVLIDQDLKARLGAVVEKNAGPAMWEDLKKFIVADQYTAESDFINKVAARISAEAQANEFVAQETFKKCVAKALELPVTDPQSCAKNYLIQNREDHIQAEKRIATVYRYIKPLNLKAEARKAQEAAGIKVEPREKGYVESSLQPILNEQGGVHIIYQILRIALIVVIAFALISVVVLLLTTVLLGDGIKVLTDQAISFIGLGRGSIAPAAKVGVLSVAALGLGGAFVAGATATPTAIEPAAYQREGGTLKSPNAPPPAGRTKDPARPNVTHHDGSDIQYTFGDSGNFYDYSQKNTLAGDNPTQPISVKLFPEFSVPRLEPIESSVFLDPSVTNAFKSSLESLEKLNQLLANKVEALAKPQTRDDIKVSNLLKNPVEKDPLLIVEAPKGPISTSLDKVETGLSPIKDVASSLDNLQVINLDRPAKPQERSFISRLVRGPSKYFVSKRSLDQLEDLRIGRRALHTAEIKKLDVEVGANPVGGILVADRIAELKWKIEADDLILAAIKGLYLEADKPTDKETLYRRLEKRLRELLSQSAMLPEKRDNTIERLEYWRDPILIYTRID